MRSLRWVALPLILASACAWAQDKPENVALGASYTLTRPNYAYCTDPEDSVQLTDGVYSEGYFWTQKTTVGWQGGDLKYITLDLGQVFPICGLSFDTAAGVAEVHWPRSLLVFVSDDGKAWREVADLVRLAPAGFLPDYGTYAVRKLETTELGTRGRYLQIAIEPGGPYCFVDEIEVYRGPDELLTAALPGEPIEDVPALMKSLQLNSLVEAQFRRDLQVVRDSIAGPGLTDEQRRDLTTEADALASRIGDMPRLSAEGFRAVLPMTDLERDILALQARVWRAQGKPALRVWQCHRWDHLTPSAEPPADAPDPVVTARMMNGEVRADVLNLTNAAAEEMSLRLRVEGLPTDTDPPCVLVRQVLYVGTRWFGSVAAALPEARREGSDSIVTVPSGMTVQAWLEFRPTDLKPGRHEGFAVITLPAGEARRVPLRLTISPLPFPEETTLLLGGWSYTDGQGVRGITPQNRDAFIEYLKDHRVNAPWATSAVLPEGVYDDQDRLTQPPDTARFDEWVEKWRGARRFMVFVAREDTFAGMPLGTPQFAARVGNWARFWAQHLRELGLQPSQLGLLIKDEPRDPAGYTITQQWSAAIHAAEPDILTFVDPIPAKPDGMVPMLEAVNILCPQRAHWMTYDWVPPLYLDQQAQGRELWFYSCSGPARTFDPFSYYLLQEWHCFAVGGKGSGFWAFSDTSGVSVWNEYLTSGPGPYCPLYLDDTSVTTGKWMEGIREGAQDYEYLVMLRDRVAALRSQAGADKAALDKAAELLRTAGDRVLAGEDGPNWRWDVDKDRGVADRVRYEVLDVLEALAPR